MQQALIRRNNINITGSGEQAMLFIHGYGCDQTMWRFITPAFEKTHKIILIDLVGSGKSDINAYDYDKYSVLQGYADDVIEICELLALKNVILVSHSVSTMIAGLAAIQCPSLFQKLIMVCPSPYYLNDEKSGYSGGLTKCDIKELITVLNENYLGWSSAIAPVIMGNPDRPQFSEELTNSFCRNDPTIARHFAELTFTSDNRSELEFIPLPTLIIQSRYDVIAPVKVGYYLNQHIKNSTLKILETHGHCTHLTAPEATIAAMIDYMLV